MKAVKVRESALTSGIEWPFHGNLRIAAYNIAHGRGTEQSRWRITSRRILDQRLTQIATLLKNEKLDIAVLNEVDFDSFRTCRINQAEYLARRAGFPFWAEQRNIDAALPFLSLRYGNAVLCRYPIPDARLLAFPGYSIWETALVGKKNGLLCTIELPDALTIHLLALHLEHRSEASRIEAVRVIETLRKLSSLPLILAGDFNSTRVDFPRATPGADGQTAISWLLSSGAYKTLPISRPGKDELTVPASDPTAVIDWILIPGDWRIVSKTVIGGQLSDHRAVVMEFRVGERPSFKGILLRNGAER